MKNEAEYMAVQNELSQKISLCDSFEIDELETAAGVDLAYWKKVTMNMRYAVSLS